MVSIRSVDVRRKRVGRARWRDGKTHLSRMSMEQNRHFRILTNHFQRARNADFDAREEEEEEE
jgi:hypothetical protein